MDPPVTSSSVPPFRQCDIAAVSHLLFLQFPVLGRQRCRNGCYGDTLFGFCSLSSNTVLDFHSSCSYSTLVAPVCVFPFSLLLFFLFLFQFSRAFWDSCTMLKHLFIRQEDRFSSNLEENVVICSLSTCFITLDKSKFPRNMGIAI